LDEDDDGLDIFPNSGSVSNEPSKTVLMSERKDLPSTSSLVRKPDCMIMFNERESDLGI
jgi:hypothetical protein